jgi:hypothetical protein
MEFDEDYRDTASFQIDLQTVEAFIRAADKRKEGDYKGSTLGVISRGTGISPDKVSLALGQLNVFHSFVLPVRYSFSVDPRKVRTVPKSEWPSTIVLGRPAMDMKAWPRIESF